jgi:hypothetical protein
MKLPDQHRPRFASNHGDRMSFRSRSQAAQVRASVYSPLTLCSQTCLQERDAKKRNQCLDRCRRYSQY